jgi:hypothetical protein
MNKFILILARSTTAQQNAVTKFYADSGVGYWHWSSEVWLLAFPTPRSAAELRDEVKGLIENASVKVNPLIGARWKAPAMTVPPPPPPPPPSIAGVPAMHIPSFWYKPTEAPSGSLRDMLAGISALSAPMPTASPEVYVLVIRVSDPPGQTDWAGFGPKEWTDWLNKSW